MSLIEVRPGQTVRLPRQPLRVCVTSSTRTAARLDILGAAGTAQRISDREAVVLPRPGSVLLTVSPTAATTFGDDDLVGLSIRVEGGADSRQVEVAQTALAAMPSARLAVLEIGEEIELAATGPQRAPAWLAPGIAALRRCGVAERDRAAPSPWSLVIDGSASMLARRADDRLTDDLRLVCGVLYGWTNHLPERALRTTAVADVDLSQLVGQPDPDLSAVTAAAPAPWSRLWPTMQAGFAAAPLVLALTDGVPVDIDAITAGMRQVKGRLLLVTTGISRVGVEPLVHSWQEELEPLTSLDRLPNVVCVAVPATGSLGDTAAAQVAATLIAQPAARTVAAGGDSW